jgi:hypothetical protein
MEGTCKVKLLLMLLQINLATAAKETSFSHEADHEGRQVNVRSTPDPTDGNAIIKPARQLNKSYHT